MKAGKDMVDDKVLETQEWLNTTYGSHSQWNDLDEDGYIGWQTIHGMIRALQIELGITTLSDNFGDGTMAALKSQFPLIHELTTMNVRRLAQSALWCHGYEGGYDWGDFDDDTNDGIRDFLEDAGVISTGATVLTVFTPKMIKGLMTLESYKLALGHSPAIRAAQQWMNRTYYARKLDLLPCDGIFTRSTQQGLMTAIQYELDMTDEQANGNFGPGTKSGLQTEANLSYGSTDSTHNWVHLFQSALRMNGYAAPLNGVFDSVTVTATSAFQSYAELAGGGTANFQTWASLLISTGDETRPGIASDMATQLTTVHCTSLYNAGYRTVGRYLSVLGKRYDAGELDRIFDAGLKTFPIMQEANTSLGDFTYEKGLDHGYQALRRLRQLGFKPGNTVFFSVDFDATDDEITSNVIPFFEGINKRMDDALQKYQIGVYGTRNVCRRVIQAGLADEAFIASMSWGWGGNLGYPLPPAWSYDQIRNHYLAGTALEIDTNIQSVRANPAGRNDVLPTPVLEVPASSGSTATREVFDESYFWYICELMTIMDRGAVANGFSRKVALYWLAHLEYNDARWSFYAPAALTPHEFSMLESFEQTGFAVPHSSTYDRMTHWAATTRGYLTHWGVSGPSGGTVTFADFGGWGGDLATAWDDYLNSGTSIGIRSWFGVSLGTTASPQFGYDDFVSDVDGYLVARMLQADPAQTLDECVRRIEVACQNDATWRFREFINLRFGGNLTLVASAGESVFTSFWSGLFDWGFIDGPQPTATEAVQIGLGFMDALKRLAEL